MGIRLYLDRGIAQYMSKYRIVFRKQDLGFRISSLYKQKQFAIGILDFGDKNDLELTLSWYMENMNLSLYVLTTEYKMEEYDIQQKYPEVTFVIFSNDTTTGEYINALADECYTDYFLVVRTDMELVAFNGEALLSIMGDKDHPFSISPVLLSLDMEVMPTIRAPYIRGKEIEPQPFQPEIESDIPQKTLYPILGVGLYDRALFQRLKSYDEEILSEYYQTLDIGVRAWLFGYSIKVTSSLAFRFPKRVSVIEDRSECSGMNRFYTKALSIRHIAGKNLVVKWKPYVDKAILNGEVKNKQIKMQKIDFFALIERWDE